MFQLRGLGAIPMSAYGAGGGPVVVESTSIDVPYLQPPMTYPGTLPPPTGGGGTYTPNAIFQLPTQPAMTYNPVGPTTNPPLPPPLPPPPPSVQPQIPVASNPANPNEPAPGGTQVYVAPPPWNAAWYKFGMSPKLWGLVVLALAAGIGGFAVYRSRR
jgi:hypothetical protein